LSFVIDICNRLHLAIERIVEYSTDANQLIRDWQARENKLRRDLERLEHTVEELTARCDETEQQLQHEIQTREYMSIEYYKVDG
jgi:ABC-type transporter Mla subunit MlaD